MQAVTELLSVEISKQSTTWKVILCYFDDEIEYSFSDYKTSIDFLQDLAILQNNE